MIRTCQAGHSVLLIHGAESDASGLPTNYRHGLGGGTDAITGEELADHAERLPAEADRWLRWGRERGLLTNAKG